MLVGYSWWSVVLSDKQKKKWMQQVLEQHGTNPKSARWLFGFLPFTCGRQLLYLTTQKLYLKTVALFYYISIKGSWLGQLAIEARTNLLQYIIDNFRDCLLLDVRESEGFMTNDNYYIHYTPKGSLIEQRFHRNSLLNSICVPYSIELFNTFNSKKELSIIAKHGTY